jgi:hypothetical protein
MRRTYIFSPLPDDDETGPIEVKESCYSRYFHRISILPILVTSAVVLSLVVWTLRQSFGPEGSIDDNWVDEISAWQKKGILHIPTFIRLKRCTEPLL